MYGWQIEKQTLKKLKTTLKDEQTLTEALVFPKTTLLLLKEGDVTDYLNGVIEDGNMKLQKRQETQVLTIQKEETAEPQEDSKEWWASGKVLSGPKHRPKTAESTKAEIAPDTVQTIEHVQTSASPEELEIQRKQRLQAIESRLKSKQ
jgi:hypothetical protein